MRLKVLMFGWEFPPHISGGLGTACLGLTQSLALENIDLLFVVPKAHGDEAIPLINASEVCVGESPAGNETENQIKEVVVSQHFTRLETGVRVAPYGSPEHVYAAGHVAQWNYVIDEGPVPQAVTTKGKKYLFSGTYGPALMEEVDRYGEVASVIAQNHVFDVIHAHDWLTYPAGIEAKRVSGKPLIVHVHATEHDRAGKNNIDQRIFRIEQQGMREADKVVAVSQWTKDILVSRYGIHPGKIEVVHNGVTQRAERPVPELPKIADHVVTFLGRITRQKGPMYFVRAARKVLRKFPDTHFVMAGSGDLLPGMIEKVSRAKMSHRFHFTGFLKSPQIDQLWRASNVYVMPSVSEPFGITPLEAVRAGVPVILSNQSGVAEVMDHCIKVDFWDTDALADAIINLLQHQVLARTLVNNSREELETISWQKAAKQLNTIYHEVHERQPHTLHQLLFPGPSAPASAPLPVL